jgi:hypothetical protein
MTDDIVTQIGVELSWIEKHGTEALNNSDHAALLVALRDEIERLREAGDWLWEAMSRHDNTRECPQCQDMIQPWKEVRGE